MEEKVIGQAIKHEGKWKKPRESHEEQKEMPREKWESQGK